MAKRDSLLTNVLTKLCTSARILVQYLHIFLFFALHLISHKGNVKESFN